ncbi:MAG: hypothetical protein CMK24_00585 [Porticoccaceae bacterium]|mgnify:CR=1 FL=1|nr:hypothetical protein [Porticoccaceae bacterium]|tara:strand:- start:2122 stop:2406 length:285 start_codon:yes stop_codon:yes gene_type:complete
MGMFVAKMADKLKDGKLGGIGMVSPLFGAINSRQKKKRQAAEGAAAGGSGTSGVGSDYSTKVISPTMMNAGGGVSKVGRGDGICRTGKTKGRMV